MKRTFFKITALVLSLMMMLTMLSACGSSKDTDPVTDEVVEKVQETEATGSESPVSDSSINSDTDSSAETDQSEKTVVSVEVYEDCDGSGHGVKVITYDDGTQEEVAF